MASDTSINAGQQEAERAGDMEEEESDVGTGNPYAPPPGGSDEDWRADFPPEMLFSVVHNPGRLQRARPFPASDFRGEHALPTSETFREAAAVAMQGFLVSKGDPMRQKILKDAAAVMIQNAEAGKKLPPPPSSRVVHATLPEAATAEAAHLLSQPTFDGLEVAPLKVGLSVAMPSPPSKPPPLDADLKKALFFGDAAADRAETFGPQAPTSPGRTGPQPLSPIDWFQAVDRNEEDGHGHAGGEALLPESTRRREQLGAFSVDSPAQPMNVFDLEDAETDNKLVAVDVVKESERVAALREEQRDRQARLARSQERLELLAKEVAADESRLRCLSQEVDAEQRHLRHVESVVKAHKDLFKKVEEELENDEDNLKHRREELKIEQERLRRLEEELAAGVTEAKRKEEEIAPREEAIRKKLRLAEQDLIPLLERKQRVLEQEEFIRREFEDLQREEAEVAEATLVIQEKEVGTDVTETKLTQRKEALLQARKSVQRRESELSLKSTDVETRKLLIVQAREELERRTKQLLLERDKCRAEEALLLKQEQEALEKKAEIEEAEDADIQERSEMLEERLKKASKKAYEKEIEFEKRRKALDAKRMMKRAQREVLSEASSEPEEDDDEEKKAPKKKIKALAEAEATAAANRQAQQQQLQMMREMEALKQMQLDMAEAGNYDKKATEEEEAEMTKLKLRVAETERDIEIMEVEIRRRRQETTKHRELLDETERQLREARDAESQWKAAATVAEAEAQIQEKEAELRERTDKMRRLSLQRDDLVEKQRDVKKRVKDQRKVRRDSIRSQEGEAERIQQDIADSRREIRKLRRQSQDSAASKASGDRRSDEDTDEDSGSDDSDGRGDGKRGKKKSPSDSKYKELGEMMMGQAAQMQQLFLMQQVQQNVKRQQGDEAAEVRAADNELRNLQHQIFNDVSKHSRQLDDTKKRMLDRLGSMEAKVRQLTAAGKAKAKARPKSYVLAAPPQWVGASSGAAADAGLLEGLEQRISQKMEGVFRRVRRKQLGKYRRSVSGNTSRRYLRPVAEGSSPRMRRLSRNSRSVGESSSAATGPMRARRAASGATAAAQRRRSRSISSASPRSRTRSWSGSSSSGDVVRRSASSASSGAADRQATSPSGTSGGELAEADREVSEAQRAEERQRRFRANARATRERLDRHEGRTVLAPPGRAAGGLIDLVQEQVGDKLQAMAADFDGKLKKKVKEVTRSLGGTLAQQVDALERQVEATERRLQELDGDAQRRGGTQRAAELSETLGAMQQGLEEKMARGFAMLEERAAAAAVHSSSSAEASREAEIVLEEQTELAERITTLEASYEERLQVEIEALERGFEDRLNAEVDNMERTMESRIRQRLSVLETQLQDPKRQSASQVLSARMKEMEETVQAMSQEREASAKSGQGIEEQLEKQMAAASEGLAAEVDEKLGTLAQDFEDRLNEEVDALEQLVESRLAAKVKGLLQKADEEQKRAESGIKGKVASFEADLDEVLKQKEASLQTRVATLEREMEEAQELRRVDLDASRTKLKELEKTVDDLLEQTAEQEAADDNVNTFLLRRLETLERESEQRDAQVAAEKTRSDSVLEAQIDAIGAVEKAVKARQGEHGDAGGDAAFEQSIVQKLETLEEHLQKISSRRQTKRTGQPSASTGGDAARHAQLLRRLDDLEKAWERRQMEDFFASERDQLERSYEKAAENLEREMEERLDDVMANVSQRVGEETNLIYDKLSSRLETVESKASDDPGQKTDLKTLSSKVEKLSGRLDKLPKDADDVRASRGPDELTAKVTKLQRSVDELVSSKNERPASNADVEGRLEEMRRDFEDRLRREVEAAELRLRSERPSSRTPSPGRHASASEGESAETPADSSDSETERMLKAMKQREATLAEASRRAQEKKRELEEAERRMSLREAEVEVDEQKLSQRMDELEVSNQDIMVRQAALRELVRPAPVYPSTPLPATPLSARPPLTSPELSQPATSPAASSISGVHRAPGAFRFASEAAASPRSFPAARRQASPLRSPSLGSPAFAASSGDELFEARSARSPTGGARRPAARPSVAAPFATHRTREGRQRSPSPAYSRAASGVSPPITPISAFQPRSTKAADAGKAAGRSPGYESQAAAAGRGRGAVRTPPQARAATPSSAVPMPGIQLCDGPIELDLSSVGSQSMDSRSPSMSPRSQSLSPSPRSRSASPPAERAGGRFAGLLAAKSAGKGRH
eukprot:TRINITY_DN41139_c0_g1_i1.p1 TRINITY_DN41139_c0_g1~~TRINITY_DN41139_c0_g1_i1.p1  ORF type:complete len:2215 (-),score=708.71 TRINITY_DN41139_c0_g1_i1:263-6907(-)